MNANEPHAPYLPSVPMTEHFRSRARSGRRQLAHTLSRELNGVLHLTLSPVSLDRISTWNRCLDALARGVADGIASALYPHDPRRTLTLIAALADRPAHPIESVVDDLAEILFIARAERSEYRQHRDITPPFRIKKLLLEYAAKSRGIDRLIGILNKGYCAESCATPPVGCCHLLGYDMGLVPDRMMSLQRIEAKWRGWTLPERPDVDACRYHTKTGCVLALFKTPACVGYLCPGIEESLAKRFEAAPLHRFYEALYVFRNCDIDRRNVFLAMDALLAAGEELLRARR